jgi:hypothetical protein
MRIDINALEKVDYEKSYVAFLDVLGFKKLVMSKNKKEKLKIEQYFGIVNSAIEYLKQIPSKRSIGSIVISDSIILSVPHGEDKKTNINKLRHLCVAIGIIQQHLALKNIWLRGAISSGDTYFNPEKRQIVGPAYVNAYLLEGSVAISPRVVLDSKIIEELEFSSATEFIGSMNKMEDGGLSYSNWGSCILYCWHYPDGRAVTSIEQDIALFIDYLAPVVERNSQRLIKIVGNLEMNIYKDATTYKKFRWVADYLKSICLRERKNDNEISSEADYRLNNL